MALVELPTDTGGSIIDESKSTTTTTAVVATGNSNSEEKLTEADDQETQRVIATDPTGRFEKYNELIGTGAYKEVYKGFDQEEGVEIAWNQLKVANLSKRDLNKIISEIQILQSLENENIINCTHYWAGKTNDGHDEIVFITELMTSGTLKSYIRKAKGPIKKKVLKNWCRQILNGLNYLHTRDPPIIHRDVKCENIFINGNHGEVKIGDLGLATFRFRDHASSVLGTPEFMAPELYDEKYDEKVDIYAFGMCVVEMVTKEYPYSECTNAAQIYKRVTAGIMPEALKKVTDPEIREFMELCLVREPEIRLSANDLLQHSFLEMEDSCDEKELEDSAAAAAALIHSIPKSSVTSPPMSTESTSHLGNGSNGGGSTVNSIGSSGQTIIHAMLSDHSKEPQTRIEVLETSPEHILLRLLCTFADNRGNQDIRFPFNIGKDTPMSITEEMVKEKLLLASLKETVADQLDRVINEVLVHGHVSSRDYPYQEVHDRSSQQQQQQKPRLPQSRSSPTGSGEVEIHDESSGETKKKKGIGRTSSSLSATDEDDREVRTSMRTMPPTMLTSTAVPTSSQEKPQADMISSENLEIMITDNNIDHDDDETSLLLVTKKLDELKLTPDNGVTVSPMSNSVPLSMMDSSSFSKMTSQVSVESEPGTGIDILPIPSVQSSRSTDNSIAESRSKFSPRHGTRPKSVHSSIPLTYGMTDDQPTDSSGETEIEPFGSAAIESNGSFTTSAPPQDPRFTRDLGERQALFSSSSLLSLNAISSNCLEEGFTSTLKRSQSTQNLRRTSQFSQESLESQDDELETGDTSSFPGRLTTTGPAQSFGSNVPNIIRSSIEYSEYEMTDTEDSHEDEEYRYLLIRQKLELENLRRRHQLERDALKKSRLARARLRASKQSEKPVTTDAPFVITGSSRTPPEERECPLAASQEIRENLMAQHLMHEVEKFGQTQRAKSCVLSSGQPLLSSSVPKNGNPAISAKNGYTCLASSIGTSHRPSTMSSSLLATNQASTGGSKGESSSSLASGFPYTSNLHPSTGSATSLPATGRGVRESSGATAGQVPTANNNGTTLTAIPTVPASTGAGSATAGGLGVSSHSRSACSSNLLPRPMSHELAMSREEVPSIDLDEFDPIKRDERKKEMTRKMLAKFESKAILDFDVSLSSSVGSAKACLAPPTLDDLSRKSKLSPDSLNTMMTTGPSSDHLSETQTLSDLSMRNTSGSGYVPSTASTTASNLASPTTSEPSPYLGTMLPELHINGSLDSKKSTSAVLSNPAATASAMTMTIPAATTTLPTAPSTVTAQNSHEVTGSNLNTATTTAVGSNATSISPVKLFVQNNTPTGVAAVSCSNQVRMPTDVLTGSPEPAYGLRPTDIASTAIPSTGASTHPSTMMSSFGGPVINPNSTKLASMLSTSSSTINIMSAAHPSSHPSLISSHDPDDHLLS